MLQLIDLRCKLRFQFSAKILQMYKFSIRKKLYTHTYVCTLVCMCTSVSPKSRKNALVFHGWPDISRPILAVVQVGRAVNVFYEVMWAVYFSF